MSILTHIFLTPRTVDIGGETPPPDELDENDWTWHDGAGGELQHHWQDGTVAVWFLTPIPSVPMADLWTWQEGDIGDWQEEDDIMEWQET